MNADYNTLRLQLDTIISKRRHIGRAQHKEVCENVLRELDYTVGLTEIRSGDSAERAILIIDALRILGAYWRHEGVMSEAFRYLELSLEVAERTSNNDSTARILSDIALAYNSISEPLKSMPLLNRALKLSEDLHNESLIAITCMNIGIVYRGQSQHAKALEYYRRAMNIFKSQNDKTRLTSVLGNIAIIYGVLGDNSKALEYSGNALELAVEQGNRALEMNLYGNIGLVHASREDYHSALEAMQKSLALADELGDVPNTIRQLGNLGGVYHALGEYESALQILNQSLARSEEFGSKIMVVVAVSGLGKLYSDEKFKGFNINLAEKYLLQAISIAESIGEKQKIYECSYIISQLYEKQQRWQEFAFHYKRYHEVEQEVKSEETKKLGMHIEFERKNSEYEKQIVSERTRASATEEVLHKVLPPVVAARLIKGEKVADYFESVSILFADIVGFTPIAAQMTAEQVLAFLNYVFGEFDRIVENNGCEKIKTIGDGYLAVAGAPVACDDHAMKLATCALEMMSGINLPYEIRTTLPKNSSFSIRIGLHSGSIFGGVVGEKRFVYDVYSDAVNTASRMESHGEAGKIHVSEDFKNKLGTDFTFTPRGEMEIKGKGKMRTFFLERA